MAEIIIYPLSPLELEQLATYLAMSTNDIRDSLISEIDGFATSLALSKALTPNLWNENLQSVLSSCETYTDAISRHSQHLADILHHSPLSYTPIMLDQKAWCVGFIKAMDSKREFWDSFLVNQDAEDILFPIIAGSDESMPEALRQEAGVLIKNFIPCIAQYAKKAAEVKGY